MTTHSPIVILGAGLGGLVAARVLHVNGIEAAVFDLEADRHARTQGGMLDIHASSGQQAIHAAGLWDAFTQLVHPGGEAMRILDHTGTVRYEETDDGSLQRPEVDRGQLRDMLIDALPDGTIRWGHKVTDVSTRDDGTHEVVFADGTAITTDLLIGADGAWSKTRALLTPAQPEYTGVSFIEAALHDGKARHPKEAAVMGDGMLFAFRGSTGILGHLEADGTLHVSLGARVPAGWVDTIDFTDAAAGTDAALALLDGWDEDLRGLIANADSTLTPRRIHALPVGLTWERVPGVTLLGDAAHLMSPFAGEGANLALSDGAHLALAIAAHPTDTEAALATYEHALFPRSAASARASAESMAMMFREDSPQGLVDMFQGFERPAA